MEHGLLFHTNKPCTRPSFPYRHRPSTVWVVGASPKLPPRMRSALGFALDHRCTALRARWCNLGSRLSSRGHGFELTLGGLLSPGRLDQFVQGLPINQADVSALSKTLGL